MSPTDDNRALVVRFVDIVNHGDLEAVTQVASGQVARDAERWIEPFRESFPDFRMELVQTIAEGDVIVGHFLCSGTHEGTWRGNPPTGRRFENIDEIYIFRIRDGKLDSIDTVVEDNLARLEQLGLTASGSR